MLKAGVCKIDITPPLDIFSGGYLSPDGLSEGVHDNLFARILFLEDGQGKVLVIVCDLVGLLGEYVQEIRRVVRKRLEIGEGAIMIASTHTHSSPDTVDIYSRIDQSYIKTLSEKIAEGSYQAFKSVRDCQISIARGKLEGVSHNRRIKMKDGTVQAEWWKPDPNKIVGPAGPIDPEVGIIRIDDSEGNLLALLVNYACHLVVTGRNKKYSSDFAGYAMNMLEKKLGGISLFINGACGNINPTKADSTFEESERLGNMLAEEVLSRLNDNIVIRDNNLSVIKKAIKLDWRNFPTIEEAKLKVENCKKYLEELKSKGKDIISFAEPELRRSQNLLDLLLTGLKDIVTEIQIIRIGKIALIGIPGELFVELGLDIKGNSQCKHPFIVTYANDYQGYIPTREAYVEGGYEVIPWRLSKLKPGTGEKIKDISLHLIKSGGGRDDRKL